MLFTFVADEQIGDGETDREQHDTEHEKHKQQNQIRQQMKSFLSSRSAGLRNFP